MPSASSKEGLAYKGIGIRYKLEDELISLTDLWVAHSKRSDLRPDRWIKLKQSQELLKTISLRSKAAPKRDENDLIMGLAGVLEVIRGGSKSFQGTFADAVVALAYAKCLSNECYDWLRSSLEEKIKPFTDNKIDNNVDNSLLLPINVEDFGGKVRFTPDGRISVYDAIAFSTGQKNPRDAWKECSERFPEVVGKTDNFHFSGKGQRPTPVANLQTFLEILVVLCNRKLLLNQGSVNFKRLPASNSTQLTIYDIKPDQ